MTKPVIVTRAGKGSALTFEEGDANFTNLQNATITVTDGSTATAIDLNGTITFTAGSGVSVTQSTGTFTIANTQTPGIALSDLSVGAEGTASGDGSIAYNNTTGVFTYTPPDLSSYLTSYTETDPVVGAVTGIVKADGAGNISAAVAGTDYLASETFTELSQDTTPQLGGNLDVNGQSIVSVSNGNITIAPNGTGLVNIGDSSNPGVISSNGATPLNLTTNGGNNNNYIAINDGANANIQIIPSGTGKSIVNNINYYETPYSLSYASTITPNVTNGNVQIVTLTGNVTFSEFTSPVAGQSLTLIVKQDATGSRTLTSTMKFAGGDKTLSTAANSIDIISVFYDGTNYWASLSKGFA